MKGPLIKPEIMEKAWLLHNKGIDSNLIASTLNISQHSAHRIIKIMTVAANDGDVDSVDGASYQKQKAFAKKMFGIEDKKEKAKPEEQKELECVSAVADMQKLIAMMAWQNELLEALLSELGVDWRNKCKGVERR